MTINKDATVDIPCENCGRKTPKSLRWLETHNEFVCGGCGTTIHVEGKQFVRDTEKAVDNAAEQLTDTFKKAGFKVK
jgi:hypothetical protein